MNRIATLLTLSILAATSALLAADDAPPAGWGTIKGQIVFAGDTIPEPVKLDVVKDQEHCLSKGPLFAERWVVNPKNKGVQWAVVFLKPERGQSLPIHDTLHAAPPDFTSDQPCCRFEPHVIALREGQKLLAKNSSPITHNMEIVGFKNSRNSTIPAGKTHVFDQLEAETSAIQIKCGIHPWMSGYLWVFDHPYFAVTDANGNFEIKLAPAGTRNLVVWQESIGWLGGREGRNGKPITVTPGGVTDVGKLEIKPN